jgi:hypothetical protein
MRNSTDQYYHHRDIYVFPANAAKRNLKMAGVIQTPKDDTWGTPDRIIKLVNRIMPTGFVDPCGNASRILPGANKTICPPDDGLAVEWYGDTYANPPYGPPLDDWMRKAAQSASVLSGRADVLMLVPVVTARRCWQRYVPLAAAVCFLAGRLRFYGAANGAAFASALILWATSFDMVVKFREETKGEGMVMIP